MFRLAKKSKGGLCKDSDDSLFNGKLKFLPGRIRRVSFVANSILLKVNQPNPRAMIMSICSLGQLLHIACLCNPLLSSCGPHQISVEDYGVVDREVVDRGVLGRSM